MAEGPFTHVVDCSTGTAVDWTQDEPELEAARLREQADREQANRLQRKTMAMERLHRVAMGNTEDILTVADLRDLLEVIG